MIDINENVKCDVRECTHNCYGRNCRLSSIKVTNTCDGCTCCGSFENKD